MRPTPSRSSRSGAPTCWRCTCARIRGCGCGCTAGGGTFPRPWLPRRRRRKRWIPGRSMPERSEPEPRRVLVLAPNWLGDAVMALPAIADVRRAFPAAHLAVAARTSVAAVFDLVPGVNEVITLEHSFRAD